MQREALAYLTTLSTVYAQAPNNLQRLVEGNPHEPTRAEPNMLRISPLLVGADSCCGEIYVFPMNMVNAPDKEWELAEQLCADLLTRRLCSSVILSRGCKRTGLFGQRFAPAVVAPPDFAKLAVLKHFGLLNVSALGQVAKVLESSAKPEKYCEEMWAGLADECKVDPRFAPGFAKAAPD